MNQLPVKHTAAKAPAKKTAAAKAPAKKAPAKKAPAKKAGPKTAPVKKAAAKKAPVKKAAAKKAPTGKAAKKSAAPRAASATHASTPKRPALMAPPTDPLTVLGLQPNFTLAQLRRAWRDHAAAHHPDAGGDAATFSRGRRAYEALSKDVSR
ncbi:hypothetical protein H7K45_19510 [Mycobacterium yunnanensis]|uniref:J domain-containing protein n=1 Tax=Mycobacterium yunnanensis TaxID=368477 RepID=A0A9X2Z5B6_9MYCO|nr:hypothetical protein [Mycobacterium yunnanensis]MCV7422739.1 hypothetical protein [Mycobacterium yunnanensis]